MQLHLRRNHFVKWRSGSITMQSVVRPGRNMGRAMRATYVQ